MRGESFLIRVPDGTRLHVRVSGRARLSRAACLLIHGFGEGGYVWNDTCEALEGVCSTVTVDLRGHGDSEPSASGRYDLATYTSDVRFVIESLGLPKLIVAGHSLGGQIALQLVADPRGFDLVAAVLVDICPDPDRACAEEAARKLRESLRVYDSPAQYQAWLLNARPLLSAERALELAKAALRPCPGGLRPKLAEDLLESDRSDPCERRAEEWEQILQAISCPTLVIRGAISAMVSVAAARRMTRMLRRGRLVTVPGAGHAVMTDNPVNFTTVFVEFIRETTPLGMIGSAGVRA